MGYSFYVLGAAVIIPALIVQLILYHSFGWGILHFTASMGIIDLLPLEQTHWRPVFNLLGGVDHRDKLGRTPLHIASQYCYSTSINALIKAGASINAVDHQKYAPLHFAVMSRHWSENPSINSNFSNPRSTIFTKQLLEYTTKHPGERRRHSVNCKASVALLLDHGSIMTLRDGNNLTAFLHTIILGNAEHTQLFLDHKILQPNSDLLVGTHSPLHVAARHGHVATIKIMLAYKRHVSAIPATGSSNILASLAIQPSCSSSAHTKILRWHVDQVDGLGFTSLHVASGNGHADVVLALLQYGADVSLAQNALKYTPLHVAAYSGHENVVMVLLRYGDGNVDYLDAMGATALTEACHNNHTQVAALLLLHGARAQPEDSGECVTIARARAAELHENIRASGGKVKGGRLGLG